MHKSDKEIEVILSDSEWEKKSEISPQKSGNDFQVSKSRFDKFAPFLGKYDIALPLTIYVFSSFLFFTVFQAVIYRKVCLQKYKNDTYCSMGKSVHRDTVLQTGANHVLLLSNVALTIPTIFSAAFLGSVSDKFSRKFAILTPFFGLILCDIGFLIQTKFMEVSVYWFLLNQFIYGVFGGYSSIFANIFAKGMASCKSNNEKSKLMGLLEGLMGIGGTLGYVSSGALLQNLGYFGVFVLILGLHTTCFSLITVFVREKKPTLLENFESVKKVENQSACKKFSQHFYQAFVTAFKKRSGGKKNTIFLLLVSYSISYFVLFGSQDIMFYYLKHQLGWSAATYGYLNGSIYGFGTLMTLFVYRLLKNLKVADTLLALIGLISRLLGRAYLSLIWSTWSTFILVPIDMFCKFGSAGLRSLISQQVDKNEQGKIFAMVSLLEAVGYLLSSVVFNALFPATLEFLPQLSFIIMAVLMLVPVTLVSFLHVQFKRQSSTE